VILLVVLTPLNLSAAFDTVDHNILLRQMRVSYGISGVALNWFLSYLTGRKHHVRYGGRCSETSLVHYGVPQGSVIGPILFIMYTADLIALKQQHGLQPHLFADDTQIVGSCCTTSVDIQQHYVTENIYVLPTSPTGCRPTDYSRTRRSQS